ncbi:MAG: hypothetical protein JW801_00505 [Bacteroidales bacterium]|nr:hypothetical protein [Bacteroidales bacterium]
MKKYLLLLVFCFLGSQAFSQDTSPFKTYLSYVPQYTFIHGIRIDIDKEIKPKKFIQICPQFYLTENSGSRALMNQDIDRLIGGGLSVYHKKFLSRDPEIYDFYLSYGLSYTYFNIEHTKNSITHFDDIHKVGGDLLIGLQLFATDYFFVDIYGGAGIRYSISDLEEFNRTSWDYNASGAILTCGMRVGIAF